MSRDEILSNDYDEEPMLPEGIHNVAVWGIGLSCVYVFLHFVILKGYARPLN